MGKGTVWYNRERESLPWILVMLLFIGIIASQSSIKVHAANLKNRIITPTRLMYYNYNYTQPRIHEVTAKKEMLISSFNPKVYYIAEDAVELNGVKYDIRLYTSRDTEGTIVYNNGAVSIHSCIVDGDGKDNTVYGGSYSQRFVMQVIDKSGNPIDVPNILFGLSDFDAQEGMEVPDRLVNEVVHCGEKLGTKVATGDDYSINLSTNEFVRTRTVPSKTYSSSTASSTENELYNTHAVLFDVHIPKEGFFFRRFSLAGLGSDIMCDDITKIIEKALSYDHYLYYDANGGSGGPSTQSALQVADNPYTFTISSTKPTWTGREFRGWSETKYNVDEGSVSYTPGGNISVSGSKTLYAVWKTATYTYKVEVDYDDGGSEISYDVSTGVSKSNGDSYSTTLKYGDSYSVTNISTPDRYTLTTSNTSGTIYSNTTTKLTYRIKKYNITYDFDGGVDGPSNTVKKYGYDIKIGQSDGIIKEPYKLGSIFNYWESSGGVRYGSGETYSVNEDLALIARWLDGDVIEFNPNGGIIETRVDYDEAEQRPKRTAIKGRYTIYYRNTGDNLDWTKTGHTTKRGYTLLGWNDNISNGERVLGVVGDREVGKYFNSAGEWIK